MAKHFTREKLDAARNRLRAAGVTHEEFARQIGVPAQVIKDILRGRLACTRGDAHRAAVALKLKKHVPFSAPLSNDLPPGQPEEARQ